MTALALLASAQAAAAWPLDYSGLPILQSPNDYKILTESVTVQIVRVPDRRGLVTATVTSTTVYRNLGPDGPVNLVVPRYREGSGTPDFTVLATWDNEEVPLGTTASAADPKAAKTLSVAGKTYRWEPAGDASALRGSMTFKAQGTHALRLVYSVPLHKTGYADTEYKAAYKLTGDHVVQLFTMAYRYQNGLIFGLPTVKPDGDWQVGDHGASLRKTDFVPGDRVSTIEFYQNSFRPIGSVPTGG